MNTIDALRRLKEELVKPGRWTRNVAFRDGAGVQIVFHDVDGDGEDPASFCMTGGLYWLATRESGLSGDLAKQFYFDNVTALEKTLAADGEKTLIGDFPTVPHFNDTRSLPEVIDLIDRTILRLKGEQHEEKVPVAHSDPQEAPVLAGVSNS